MTRTKIQTYRHRIDKNHYLIIQVYQKAFAKTDEANAVATNALNIKIIKQKSKHRRRN